MAEEETRAQLEQEERYKKAQQWMGGLPREDFEHLLAYLKPFHDEKARALMTIHEFRCRVVELERDLRNVSALFAYTLMVRCMPAGIRVSRRAFEGLGRDNIHIEFDPHDRDVIASFQGKEI